MRSDTKTVSVAANTDKVLNFLADPRNLPRWAVGFAKEVRNHDGRWIVSTGGGEMGIRIESDRRSGAVDFFLSPAPGVEAAAYSRVIPRGDGSEYVFTQFQAPGMPDQAFEQSVKALTHELSVLRALLEVECPL